MKAFGLELRKFNGMESVYKDVDMILSNKNIESEGVSDDLKVQTVAHSLNKMLKGGYFSICQVQYCAKICNVFIPKERLDIYQSIHCMDWSEMTDDYRATIMAMILDDFRIVLNR